MKLILKWTLCAHLFATRAGITYQNFAKAQSLCIWKSIFLITIFNESIDFGCAHPKKGQKKRVRRKNQKRSTKKREIHRAHRLRKGARIHQRFRRYGLILTFGRTHKNSSRIDGLRKTIIATKVPGAAEIGFKGWLIEPRNVEELRKAIMEASKTPKKILDKMGKMNRKIALTKFDWTTTYNKIYQILQTVTKSNL